MAYEVPQYIETEDKIIGPLTLRQFLYLLFGAIIDFLLYVFLNFFIWIIIALPVALLALALAFYKPGGQKFEKIFVAAFNWFLGARYFFWQRKEAKKSIKIENFEEALAKKEKKESKLKKATKKEYKIDELVKMLDKK